ncbi:nucleotide exchange factor GrpE [Anaerococcus sp.]|uniref:nucleotide exchange factor GrpE n=1 Tax=Anaerococcus sp. TaxID=1872515 RepID=UPI0027BABF85|nr:nucleotide exchange factor GrpE [Anaerococcus sp.]MDD6919041.1 nucleotide exchange factor GrpE [Peptoniphilaceae bacterium]MDU2584085.1 nucleotide exchange factor GrpE [Anaerococcus prevotii]MDY2928257.1 nucleotide exchange factor GrpE [Anaerococcus sp.]
MANEEKKDENLDIEDKEIDEEDYIEAEIVDDEEDSKASETEEVNEYQERYQRLLADFENYKKREEASKADFKKFAQSSLIEKLLPVIDNLDRALAKADEDDAFVEGVIMTRKELMKILENEGLEEIESDGCEFDHNVHQAVLAEENDEVEENHIIETFQKGYKLNGRVLRPAMVKVSK